MASLRLQGTWRRCEDPGTAADEADYGQRKGKMVGVSEGLSSDNRVFVTA